MISIVIPANNEERMMPQCLTALLASAPFPETVEIIVAANGCSDATVQVAQDWQGRVAAKGWGLVVLDLKQGGKMHALNQADAVAQGDKRIYLDADVVVDPDLLGELSAVLAAEGPVYASGDVRIAPARSFFSRAYRQIYKRVPFFTHDVPGCGVFAVNAAARRRWGAFPDIISDDTFVRLSFSPQERVRTRAGYDWPIVEGFGNLVKVRRRQNIGVAEVASLYPGLMKNDQKSPMGVGQVLRLALRHPLGFFVYGSVSVVVKLTQHNASTVWSRGR